MRSFSCEVCGNLLVAENSVCVACGTPQGFAPSVGGFVPVAVAAERGWAQCANLASAGCNWLVDDGYPSGLCRSCRLTRTRPRDDDGAGLVAWATTEGAKRRLVYQLLDLGLPVVPRSDDVHGLAFDLLSSRYAAVTTRHADGVVTIDLAEGEDAHREAMRVQMGEPYRTMLGHLRHEVGHYYWQVLVRGDVPGGLPGTPPGTLPAGAGAASSGSVTGPEPSVLQRFRDVFGDEREHYGAALGRHYSGGPGVEWVSRYVSGYATAHPWEDWAETFAHYLHIRDTLQTAASYGMVVTGPERVSASAPELVALPLEESGAGETIESVVSTWLPLTYALNAVNRSMGKGDLYPFVLNPPVVAKLGFVHDLVTGRAG